MVDPAIAATAALEPAGFQVSLARPALVQAGSLDSAGQPGRRHLGFRDSAERQAERARRVSVVTQGQGFQAGQVLAALRHQGSVGFPALVNLVLVASAVGRVSLAQQVKVDSRVSQDQAEIPSPQQASVPRQQPAALSRLPTASARLRPLFESTELAHSHPTPPRPRPHTRMASGAQAEIDAFT